MKDLQYLEKLNFYQAAGESVKEKLRKGVIIRSYKRKEYLFHIRDRVESLFVVSEGFAVVERDSQDHGTKSIFLLGSGDFANEVILDQSPASVSCYALTDLTVVCIPRILFLELMKADFSFSKLVVDSMALKIRKLYHQVESTTKPTKLDHQVASRLWKFGRDYGIQKGEFLELPFRVSITFLASFVGSNRETVSRIVKKMADENILSIKNGTCIIYDMDKLKRYASLEGHTKTPKLTIS